MMNLGTLITFTDEQRNELEHFCRCSHGYAHGLKPHLIETLKNEARH
ncbi:MAG: hypothetical protein K8R50_11905 [Betaproteobacteria bacterium]|nr:hypothetical protein [Betaproteobacteria bacterium]